MPRVDAHERRGGERRADHVPPVIVCVHGLSGSARWWSGVRPWLERAGRVVVPDVPRSLRPEQLTDWLIGRLEALEPPVHLVGHSLGALVSAGVAGRRPGLVRRLVLVAPPGIVPRSVVAYLWPVARTVTGTTPRFVATVVGDALRSGPMNILRGGRHVSAAEIGEELASVVAPTLLVWGARDRIVPPAEAAVWQAKLAGARLVVLPRAGHVPMVEAPEELGTAIAAFLEERLDDPSDERSV